MRQILIEQCIARDHLLTRGDKAVAYEKLWLDDWIAEEVMLILEGNTITK